MRKFLLVGFFSLMLSGVVLAAENPPTKGGNALEKATFAGGCFWCMEPPFMNLKGIKTVVSGYTGGRKKNPTYEEVCSGATGHAEAVQVTYDPKEISYETLLDTFWRNIDPTDAAGQFVDRGSQYRTAVFYHTKEQKRLAEKSKEGLSQSGRFKNPLATQIVAAGTFYPAESYHQGFCRLNPQHYKNYRAASGRDEFLKNTWGSENKDSH